jgi:hypothetical protein
MPEYTHTLIPDHVDFVPDAKQAGVRRGNPFSSGGIRMSRIVLFVPLVSLFLPPAVGDEPKSKARPAAELLSAGLAQAKDQGKTVFLLFGSPG